jgi:hypothetical protein
MPARSRSRASLSLIKPLFLFELKFECSLVNEKEGPPFTGNEGWSERVADVKTMGLGPRT